MAAATPGFGRHDGRMTALATVILLSAAFLAASVTGSLVGSGVALIDLAAIVTTLLIAGLTYLVAWTFNRFVGDRRRRHRNLVVATIGLGCVFVLFLTTVAGLITIGDLAGLAAALPFSAFAILVLRAVQRNRKEPWRLTLVAVGWGGVVATNLAALFEGVYGVLITAHLIPGPGQGIATAFAAGLFEEGGKGLAVVFLYLLARDQFDDVVSGIVLGAAVGVGFNLIESVGYMSSGFLAQLWIRQVVGLFAGHATYTALTGAGIGAARQQSVAWRRWVCALSGFVAAVAAHFLYDAVTFTQLFPSSGNGLVDLFVLYPLQVACLDGPWTAALIVLLYVGLRREGAALRTELAGESATGLGAIVPAEVAVLVSPRWRAHQRWLALRRRGWRSFRRQARLQRAQLDLAVERWHRARQEIDQPLAAEAHLRERVLQLKAAAQR